MTKRLALFVILLPLSMFATESLHPAVTSNTIYGVWQAVSERSVRVFQLELNDSGNSYLSWAVPHGHAAAYRLTQMSISEGAFAFTFHSVDTNGGVDTIQVEGTGVAGGDGGLEEGELTTRLIMNPEETPQNIWELRFVKGWTIKDLFALSQDAARAIEESKQIDQVPLVGDSLPFAGAGLGGSAK